MRLTSSSESRIAFDLRLGDALCEMKPDFDDSITGFNVAWDLVSKLFQEELEKLE